MFAIITICVFGYLKEINLIFLGIYLALYAMYLFMTIIIDKKENQKLSGNDLEGEL